jgi:hypothetical protein
MVLEGPPVPQNEKAKVRERIAARRRCRPVCFAAVMALRRERDDR